MKILKVSKIPKSVKSQNHLTVGSWKKSINLFTSFLKQKGLVQILCPDPEKHFPEDFTSDAGLLDSSALSDQYWLSNKAKVYFISSDLLLITISSSAPVGQKHWFFFSSKYWTSLIESLRDTRLPSKNFTSQASIICTALGFFSKFSQQLRSSNIIKLLNKSYQSEYSLYHNG